MAKIDEIKPLPAASQTGISGGQQAIAYLVFAVIMAVLCLLIGVKLIGDAISGLST